MSIKVIIVAFDFYKENIPLQPWKYIYELALAHKMKGDEVVVLSNCNNKSVIEKIPNINVKYIDRISPFNKNIIEIINKLSPDKTYWWSSPRTFLYKSIFRNLKGKLNLLYTGPLYNYSEILTALQHITFSSIRPYLIDLCTPKYLLKKLVNSSTTDMIFTISQRNRERFIKMGVDKDKIKTVYIGKDPTVSKPKIEDKRSNNTFLYITAATKIRGVELLLKAFAMFSKEYPEVKLKILARPSPEYNKQGIDILCQRLEIAKKVIIIDGWLEREGIENELKKCRALVMPFVLVPSEMPLSVIEAFSMNTPVIVSNIDGLPEMVGDRGWVFEQGSKNDLNRALVDAYLLKDKEYLKIQNNIFTYYNNLCDWSTMMQQFLNL